MAGGVIVDEKFCFKEETDLTVRKTFVFFPGDGFLVYDPTGNSFFKSQMLIFQPCSFSLYPQSTLSYQFSRHCTYFPSGPIVSVPKQNFFARTGASLFGAKQNRAQRTTQNVQREIEEEQEIADDYYDDDGGDGENEFQSQSRFRGREEEEKDYDRDPEFAEILGSCLGDPQKAQSKMKERLRRRRNKVLHTKTGSATPIKLGDPQNKGASNADFHFSNLLSELPNMKVNFLSRICLSHKVDGPKVAKRLIDVYFALFKVLITELDGSQKVDKNGKAEEDNSDTSQKHKVKNLSKSHVELDSRLLSALLTVHSKNFNVGVQALLLLDKISAKNQIVSDRFYRALYSKLLLPAAMNSSKAEMFIGLLLRAMKSDINLK